MMWTVAALMKRLSVIARSRHSLSYINQDTVFLQTIFDINKQGSLTLVIISCLEDAHVRGHRNKLILHSSIARRAGTSHMARISLFSFCAVILFCASSGQQYSEVSRCPYHTKQLSSKQYFICIFLNLFRDLEIDVFSKYLYVKAELQKPYFRRFYLPRIFCINNEFLLLILILIHNFIRIIFLRINLLQMF